MQGRTGRQTHRVGAASGRRISHSDYRAAFETLEERRMLAPVPELLKDINAPTRDLQLSNFTDYRDVGYFVVRTTQLWQTDGSADGTQLIYDFTSTIQGMTVWQDSLWLSVQNSAFQLWKFDGTTFVGISSMSAQDGAGSIASTSAGIFFGRTTPADGYELWFSDGSGAGTKLLKDVFPGSAGSSMRSLTAAGDRLYFTADDGTHGRELWTSDGTVEGTLRLTDIGQNAPNGVFILSGHSDGTAYIGLGSALWKSNGTSAGTIPLGVSSGDYAVLLGDVYYPIRTMSGSSELWKVDGSDGLHSFVQRVGEGEVRNLRVIDDRLYFSNHSQWQSDGTEAGTVVFRQGAGHFPVLWTSVNGKLVGAAFRSDFGIEPLSVEPSGETVLRDIRGGELSSSPKYIGRINQRALFLADDGFHGWELCATDGTEVGTVMLKDIDTRIDPSSTTTNSHTIVSGTTFFTATDDLRGEELWKTDGTSEGTFLVKELGPGYHDAEIYSLGNLNGTLMFTRLARQWEIDDVSELELWRSDGTESGTTLVTSLGEGQKSITPQAQLTIGGVWYFAIDDHDHGGELWRTDGTADGTYLVKDIYPGPEWSWLDNFIAFEGKLFFTADDGAGISLWMSDGTESGTSIVKRLDGIQGLNGIEDMMTVGGKLFFSHFAATNRKLLWTSDGTSAGTGILLTHELEYSSINHLVALDDLLLFTVGGRLMVSDGTAAGTRVLRDEQATSLVEVNGTVFFLDKDADHGSELWRTDGTAAGTWMVADLVPGPTDAKLGDLTNLNGTLLFNDYYDYSWISDGTAQGTRQIAKPAWRFLTVGETSLLTFLDEQVGRELYRVDNPTARIDLNGALPGQASTTDWSEYAMAIATSDATIALSQSNLQGIRVRLLQPRADDYLFADITGTSILASFNGESLWLGGIDSRANYEEVLRRVRYQSLGGPPASDVLIDVQAFTLTGFAPVAVRSKIVVPPQVVSRQLFYNDSAFDGGSTAVNAADDGAIAPDKSAYLPGSGRSTTASISSYVHGINGVMIDIVGLDIARLGGSLTADDFTFRVGTSASSPENWALAPSPLEIVLRAGAGLNGSNRVTITWANGAIKNTWLQVTVKGNDAAGGFNTNTGLAGSDVFFFGSRVGDTFEGASAISTATTSRDELAARVGSAAEQALTSLFDFNRDGMVTAVDQLIARQNVGVLRMIEIDDLAEAVTRAPADSRFEMAFALAIGDNDESGEEDSADFWWGAGRRLR